MVYVLIGVLGFVVLGIVVRLRRRGPRRLSGVRRDRRQTSDQAQREAELQARHNIPFR